MRTERILDFVSPLQPQAEIATARQSQQNRRQSQQNRPGFSAEYIPDHSIDYIVRQSTAGRQFALLLRS